MEKGSKLLRGCKARFSVQKNKTFCSKINATDNLTEKNGAGLTLINMNVKFMSESYSASQLFIGQNER